MYVIMRRTKEEAEKTRQDILDAALAVFSEKGFQTARLQDIAQVAGTTRGAIYHHFQNKADLYKSLLEEAAQQGNRAVQQAIETGGSFADICRNIFIFSANLLTEDERFRQIVALSLYKTGVSPELAELEEMRIQNAVQTVQGIAAYMQQGVAVGEVRTDIDTETIARAFLAFQNGITWLWLANGEFFSIQDDAPRLVDILFNGIGKR